jgi:hypothetical protein
MRGVAKCVIKIIAILRIYRLISFFNLFSISSKEQNGIAHITSYTRKSSPLFDVNFSVNFASQNAKCT